MGILPDALVCRAPFAIGDQIKTKLSLFCSIPKENIIDSLDVNNIYQIPINYYEQKIDATILKQFKLPIKRANIGYWKELINTVNSLKEEIEISLVGKYIELHDAYLSVNEALTHAGYKHKKKIIINWIDSESLEKSKTNIDDIFKNSKGIIVPGGFGKRGIEGKIKSIKYARENNIPFLGLCLGMQLATIEFARNVCNIKDANSTEFDPKTTNPVIDIMENQKKVINKGGTLRLGNYDCKILNKTLAFSCYKNNNIKERHRHRYEFNNKYKKILEDNGMVFSGINEKSNLVEIIEIPYLNFFIACQFHPEFKSRPYKPHPLFDNFILSTIKKQK